MAAVAAEHIHKRQEEAILLPAISAVHAGLPAQSVAQHSIQEMRYNMLLDYCSIAGEHAP
jgi:hypothetical protein